MSLATSCPSCGTVFRVVQDQLKISEGWVRCGHCQEVFNALEGLFDLSRRDSTIQEHAPDLAVPATSDPKDPAWMETRPAMFSDGRVLRERQEALQSRSATPVPPLPAPRTAPSAAPATRIEISTRRAATWDPSVQEPERGMAPTQPDPGAWRTTSADTTLPVPPLNLDFRSAPRTDEPVPDSLLAAPDLDAGPSSNENTYPATTLEFRSEAFGAFAAAKQRQGEHPDVDLSLEWPAAHPALAHADATDKVAAKPVVPAKRVVHAIEVSDTPLTTASPAPTAAATESPPTEPAPDLEKTLDLSAGLVTDPVDAVATPPAPAAPATATAAAAVTSPQTSTQHPTDDSTLLPEFVRHANRRARWHRPLVRTVLGSVAVLMTGLLLGQITRHWHDLIAARWPVTQPLLVQACAQWHCRLQAPALLEALVVDSTSLTRPPNTDHFVLGVTLHNGARHAVAAPHIELSLTDMAGAVVLRRVLTPAEFKQADTLAAQSDASWSLVFASTNQRVAGYTLAAFYP